MICWDNFEKHKLDPIQELVPFPTISIWELIVIKLRFQKFELNLVNSTFSKLLELLQVKSND